MPIIPREIQKALVDFFGIYELAEEIYKKAQHVLGEIGVDNEFRYCARNLVDFLKIANLQQPDSGALLEAIYRATHAAKNAVNDSVDLSLDHASKRLKELHAIDKEKELSYYVHNLENIVDAIGMLEEKIARSRRDLAPRIEIYRQIYDSAEFKTVLGFAHPNNVASIRERIAIDQYHMVKDQRKFWLTIVIGILGIVGFSNLAKLLG
ncbi:MAG: hypothetical protein LBF50_03570 [Azoarcus sp.]|jgi:hypothetical protein|nr:hypothetical protein [Azoarcus sp.]